MTALLRYIYPQNKEVEYFLSSVLSNVGNYRGLDLVNAQYSGETLLDRLYTNFSREHLSIPGQEEEHFFIAQKNVYDRMSDPYLSFSGPTSMGKSFVMRVFLKQQVVAGKKANFALIVPTKALINEVTSKIINDLKYLLSEKDYRLVTSAGALALKQKRNFIFVLTPERLLYLLISNPKIQIDYLFVDEAHKISSKDKRSAFYYKVVDMLASQTNKPHIVFASPNIPNPEIYLNLIPDLEEAENQCLTTSYTPVSQMKYMIDFVEHKLFLHNNFNHNLEFVTKMSPNARLSDMILHVGENSQNVIYCSSKSNAIDFARQYANYLKPLDDKSLLSLARDIRNEVHGDYYLAELISKGVAYHIGYLPSNIRMRIEDYFKQGLIKTMFCTSTLVEGVNLPADNLFITSYKNGRSKMNAVDFKNLVGRVGRIEYNLYGNVFLVRLNPDLEKEKFVELLDKEVPVQQLSVVTELSKNQKKKIIESLLQGNIELLKHPKSQTNDEYALMRKFALILLRDITVGHDSTVKKEFEAYLTDDVETNIRNAFADKGQKPDDDINLSVDQYQNLTSAVERGLAYPQIGEKGVDYGNLVEFLEHLCRIFKWEIYERQTLGKTNKQGEHSHLRFYATVLCQWIQGYGLSNIVVRAIEHKEKHPETGVWLNNWCVAPYYNNTVSHKNYVIAEALSVIDSIILFNFSNYFLRFSSEYKKYHQLESFANDWYEFVEYGTTNPLTIMLQRSGFSREASTYIKDHRDEYVTGEVEDPKLRLSLLECGDNSVRAEASDIRFNVPELFVDNGA
ncbi:MAG: DEAD/DEAH box helicase [Oscillospiraceae bacterium]